MECMKELWTEIVEIDFCVFEQMVRQMAIMMSFIL